MTFLGYSDLEITCDNNVIHQCVIPNDEYCTYLPHYVFLLKQPVCPADDCVVQPVQRPHRLVVLSHEHHLQRSPHRRGGRRGQVRYLWAKLRECEFNQFFELNL